MARPHTPFHLLAADQAALEEFTDTGCRPVRAVRRAQAPRSGAPPRFGGSQRAAVTALACTPAPTGHGRWTLRLLTDKAVKLGLVETISHETVSQVLKKTSCSPTTSSTGVWGR